MKQESSPDTQEVTCERLQAVLSYLGRIGALEEFWRASRIRYTNLRTLRSSQAYRECAKPFPALSGGGFVFRNSVIPM